MPFPSRNEIEIPILMEVEAAGGELRPTAALFKELATYFPQLTEEDLGATNRTGINTWENRVHWARLRLVHKGELDRSRYGVWRITEKGQQRIRSEVGEVSQARETKESLHSKISRQVEEIGRILGHYARREFREGPYSFDVIWKDAESLPRATHVFEVQDKGNVVEALARLKHAYDSWGARLFLVVTDEKDRARVEKMLVPLFSGTFHEIGSLVSILSPSDVEEIHSTLDRYKNIMVRFVAR
jgi:hypothetical protein